MCQSASLQMSVCAKLWTGTGSSGATIRMYIEKYVSAEAGPEALSQETADAVGRPCIFFVVPRQTDRQTDRQTHRQTDGRAGGQTDR
jgi:hypothetical protein